MLQCAGGLADATQPMPVVPAINALALLVVIKLLLVTEVLAVSAAVLWPRNPEQV